MKLNTEASQTPVRAAASVLMLRDGQDGLRVFLLRRHGLSDVLGGAYVFPGGQVDEDDALLAAHLDVPGAILHSAFERTPVRRTSWPHRRS